MRVGLPGKVPVPGKYRQFISPLILLILAGLLTWSIYAHFHKPPPVKVNAGTDISSQQLENSQSNAAQTSVKSQDYAQAVSYYYGAASNEYAQQNYQQAKSLLMDCINKVPDQYVTWYIYYSLSQVAKSLNDTALQKSSLQTAIAKASAPGSDAGSSAVTLMQKQLQAIK